MTHKHKLEDFKKLLVSIANGECVDTNINLDEYGLDADDLVKLEAAKKAAQQLPSTKPNNNNFPADYLEIIRNNSAPEQSKQPELLFDFNAAAKGLRRPKKDTESNKQLKPA